MTTTQYIRAFVRFWWVLALCAGIGAGVALSAAARATPTYKASVTLVFAATKEVPRTTPDFASANALAVQRAITDAAAADGTVLERETAGSADPTALAGRLSVKVPTGSNVLVVTAADSDADGARSLAVRAGTAMERIVTSLESRTSGGRPLLRARLVPSSLTLADLDAPPAGRDPLLCGLAGLLVGLALAALLARLFPRLRDPKIASELAKAPVLGVLRGRAGTDRYEQALAETRTGIFFLREEDSSRLLVALATPRPDDKASDLTHDLAADMALTRARVLLVDADLRESGESRQTGLADFLTSASPLHEAVMTDPRGFDVIAAGRAVDNVDELLHHDRLAALLKSTAQRYDYVLIITPPTSAGTGAPAVAGRCGATVVIVKENTRARDLRECVRVLGTTGKAIRGVVVTPRSRISKGSRAAR